MWNSERVSPESIVPIQLSANGIQNSGELRVISDTARGTEFAEPTVDSRTACENARVQELPDRFVEKAFERRIVESIYGAKGREFVAQNVPTALDLLRLIAGAEGFR